MLDSLRSRSRVPKRGRAPLASILCLSFVGCGLPGTGSPGLEIGDFDSITSDELMEIPGANLYDVLLRARPLWLMEEGSRTRTVNGRVETAVVTDGRYFGGLGTLRELSVAGVQVVHYATGSDAAHRFAGALVGRHVDAVISVEFGGPEPDR